MPYFNIFIPILSICFNILAQVFCYKYIVKKALLRSEYLGFVCGFGVFAIGELIAYQGQLRESLFLSCVNLIIYACFAYGYFSFINLGETARRIRLLRELYESPGGLTKEEILRKYNADAIINIRLGRLLNNKQIILHDGKYYSGGPVMLMISKTVIFIKQLVLGKSSEFEK
jgi:hypothetical protein